MFLNLSLNVYVFDRKYIYQYQHRCLIMWATIHTVSANLVTRFKKSFLTGGLFGSPNFTKFERCHKIATIRLLILHYKYIYSMIVLVECLYDKYHIAM